MTATIAAPTRARSLWAHADFRRLWIGETTSALGSSVTAVALPLVALTTLHAGVVAVSLLSAAAWLPWLVIGLPAGAWVDRLPRRPVMMAADVVSMVLFASVPVAAWFGLLTLAQLLVVALLTGTAKVFATTAYRAFLPAVVGEEHLVEGNSRLQGGESAAQVAGPGLGGAIAELFGAVAGLLADALSFAVSLACLRRITATEPSPRPVRRPLRADIGEGLRFVRDDRLLRRLTLFGGAANLALTGFSAIEVAFLVRELHLGSAQVGALLAAAGVGGVAGAVVAPALVRRLGSARALLVCKAGTVPVALLIPLAGRGWGLVPFVVGTVVPVAGIVAGNVVSGGFFQRYVPRGLMGRVSTAMQVVNFGTIPIGALLGGLLADRLGYRPALWLLLGGLLAATGILLGGPLRGRRDLPTRPPEAS